MSWPVRATEVVYENPWIRVREDVVTRPDGTDGIYGVVELQRPAVFVVALTDDDEVVLVTLDRHTVGTSVEVPAGGTDGEDPLAAARRELVEETGLVARDWRQVGTMNALNGVCRAPEVVFLARGLEPAPGAADTNARAEEGIREVRRAPVRDVLGLVRDGAITDGETIAALMLALVALDRVS
ncbi:NUDIX domain-containing protein [Terrabacter sp. Root181]|uniref:NUDIX domain-containing protein n=1 Tax=Terrabacter sp. Root181 TaxID=1736484 RepID=UPI0006F39DBE|nr:NUDIX hydrolase [Terrabacter sp. Root181]KRB47563.1 NUDIX hydrolase [Terrabacter sp. Root181]